MLSTILNFSFEMPPPGTSTNSSAFASNHMFKTYHHSHYNSKTLSPSRYYYDFKNKESLENLKKSTERKYLKEKEKYEKERFRKIEKTKLLVERNYALMRYNSR